MHDKIVQAFPWVGRSLRSSCERGVCQSVSPMFPNSCWTRGEGGATLTKDNHVLQETIEKQGLEYTRIANVANRYSQMDQERINYEMEDENVVISLIDPTNVLARLNNGRWTRV